MTEFVPVDGLAIDHPGRARFDAWVQVYARCASAVLDGDADERTPDEFRELERDPARERLGIAAVNGDVVVGALAVILPLRDNVTVAVVRVAVLPEYRGQGLGSALLARGEALARSRGRRYRPRPQCCPPGRPGSRDGIPGTSWIRCGATVAPQRPRSGRPDRAIAGAGRLPT
ncbi:MAG: GNAT family N-acetyltransferase [Phycicoccus sp.]|nr:GNAT family N-acetyltransferase [Phycicoccus sp.]